MADDKVDIIVKDKIDASISTKLNSISDAALKADSAVIALNKALNSIRYSSVTALSNALTKVSSVINTVTTNTRSLSTVFTNYSRAAQDAALASTSLNTSLTKTLVAQDATVGSGRQMQTVLIASTEAVRAQVLAIKSLSASLEQATRARRDLNTASKQTISVPRSSSVQATTTSVPVSSNSAIIGAEVAAPAALAAAAFTKMQRATVENNNALRTLVATQNRNVAASLEQKIAANKFNGVLAEQNNSIGRHQQFLAGTTRTWGVMLRWVAAYHVAIRSIQALDVSTTLNNKIRAIVATTEDETRAISSAVYDVAERSRSSVEAVGTAFVRFDLSLRNYGASVQESLRFTETFSKALVISGASAGETSSGLLQLSQAMNKGKLDGDEFRNMMETAPLVMDAVAKSMGLVGNSGEILRGKLLQLAPQGKITGSVLREAIGGMASDIDSKFKKLDLTIGQSLTLASNRFTRWINDIQNSTGIVTQFANLIEFLTRDISLLIQSIITATVVNYAFKAGFAINNAASLRNANIAGINAELTANKILLVQQEADAARRKTLHLAENAMYSEKIIAEKTLAKEIEARLLAEKLVSSTNLKRVEANSALVTAGANTRAAPLIASVAAFKQEAIEKKKIAEEVYTASVAAAASQLNLAKTTAQSELDILQRSYNARKGSITKALKEEVAAKATLEAASSGITSSKNAIEVIEAKMRAEELYQNKIKDAPNLHGRYIRSLKEMEKLEATRTSTVLALASATEALPKAEIALEAAQTKVMSKELARNTIEQQMLVGKAKLTQAEVVHAQAVSAAEMEKSRAYALSEAAFTKAKIKQAEVDAVFTTAQTKSAAAVAKVHKANAAAEAALITEGMVLKNAATAETSLALKAADKSLEELRTATNNVLKVNAAVTASQASLATAEASFLSRLVTGIGKALSGTLRFIFSLGGLVTAVLGGAAAFVIFSDKIKLYEDNNGATAADALTVAIRGLFNAVTGTPEPFKPIEESVKSMGVSMMNAGRDLAKLADIFSEAFNGDVILSLGATIFAALGVLTLNIGFYLGKAFATLFIKLSVWTLSLGLLLGQLLYNVLYYITDWGWTLGKFLVTAVWNGLKYLGGGIYDFGAYLAGLFAELFSWVIDKISGLVDSVKNFFVGLWQSIFGGDAIDSTETRAKLKSEINKIGADIRDDLNTSILDENPDWLAQVNKTAASIKAYNLPDNSQALKGLVQDTADYEDALKELGITNNQLKNGIGDTNEIIVTFNKTLKTSWNNLEEYRDVGLSNVENLKELSRLHSVLRDELDSTYTIVADNQNLSMLAGLDGARELIINFERAAKVVPDTFEDIKNIALSSADAINQLKVAFQELSNLNVAMPQIAAEWKTTLVSGPKVGSWEQSFSNFEQAVKEQAEKRKQKEVDLTKKRPGSAGEVANTDEKRSVSLAKINKELDNEIARFGTLGEARKIQEKMDSIEEKLLSKKITLSKEETEILRNKVILTIRNAAVQSEMDSIYQDVVGQQQKYIDNETALQRLLKDKVITINYYTQAMDELRIKNAELQLQLGNENWSAAILVSISKVTDGFKNMISSLSSSFGTFFTSLTDGFARSISRSIAFSENLKESLLDVARNALAELTQALLKMQIQYLITKAIGGSLFGGDTGWLTTIIPGFSKGGYTGNTDVSAIAGVAHGQEYIFDAQSTKRIGVETLNALRSGKINLPTAGSAANSNTPMNVSIANYGTSKSFSVEQISLNEVRIIAQDEANKAVATKTEKVVASRLNNPNSSISKALSRTTTTARKR